MDLYRFGDFAVRNVRIVTPETLLTFCPQSFANLFMLTRNPIDPPFAVGGLH